MDVDLIRNLQEYFNENNIEYTCRGGLFSFKSVIKINGGFNFINTVDEITKLLINGNILDKIGITCNNIDKYNIIADVDRVFIVNVILNIKNVNIINESTLLLELVNYIKNNLVESCVFTVTNVPNSMVCPLDFKHFKIRIYDTIINIDDNNFHSINEFIEYFTKNYPDQLINHDIKIALK